MHENVWRFKKLTPSFNGDVKYSFSTQASLQHAHTFQNWFYAATNTLGISAMQRVINYWNLEHTQTCGFHGAQNGCGHIGFQRCRTKLFVGCLMERVHSAWVSERGTTCTLPRRAHMLPHSGLIQANLSCAPAEIMPICGDIVTQTKWFHLRLHSSQSVALLWRNPDVFPTAWEQQSNTDAKITFSYCNFWF